MIKTSSVTRWTEYFQQLKDTNHPLWPTETIVRVIFGRYLKNRIQLKSNGQVLDVGCGFGNNLLPFIVQGWQASGTEVSAEIAEQITEYLAGRGLDADIRVGENRHLPFSDNHFDILLSINVLHYENDIDGIDAALNEYKRVLAPDGAVVIYTAGPELDIFKSAEKIGPNQYRIQNYDFRNGEEYFYFETEEYLESFMKRHFKDVEIGRMTEKISTQSLDFFIAVCRDPLP